MSERSHEVTTKDQPSPSTFSDLVFALNEALKARARHMHDMEIAFQANTVYTDHRWKDLIVPQRENRH
jgi:hypothetical protein